MIISKGLLEVIVSNLDKDNSSKLLSISLVCIEKILEHGEDQKKSYSGDNPYVTRIIENGTTCILENLQKHSDFSIYQQSVKLIERFFNSNDQNFLGN